MKVYVVDIEEVLRNYKNYHESIDKINLEKDKFSDEIESIKKEMEGIINQSRLIIDESGQREAALRFKELQSNAIQLEQEFRGRIIELQNSELDKNVKEVSDIISEWSNKMEFDVILNKSQTIFTKKEFDLTENVLTLLKEKELFKSIQNIEDLEVEDLKVLENE
jgi:Skp family chaperone for outer membrane proteins